MLELILADDDDDDGDDGQMDMKRGRGGLGEIFVSWSHASDVVFAWHNL